MSISSEISRISQNVSDSLTAVGNKGVTVPSGSNSDDLPSLISQITSPSDWLYPASDLYPSSSVYPIGVAYGRVTVEALTITQNGTYTAQAGTAYNPVTVYVSGGGGSPNLQNKTVSYTPSETAQSNTVTKDFGYDGLGNVTVNVGAISSTYVGSGITRRSSTDLTASGATVTVPAGYYASQATKTVSGGGGTPNLQDKTGITPTESSQTITADTGYDGLSSVQIDAISSTYVGSGITSRSSTDLSASGATVTVPAGYYSTQATKSVASGSATAPASISGTSASVSTGTNTLTLSKTVSVTPSVSAGYVSSGTAGNSSVSLTASVTTKGATTYRAGTTQQTISSGTYLTGTQTIAAVSQTNLSAENIKSGTTISISNGSSNIWSVTGTYTGSGGGGGSMNVQTNQSTSRTTSTSLTSVNSLTCSTTGTYDVYWTCTRSSTSGTWSSRLYVGGTASGSEQTTWSNHVQTVKLTGVSISANQTVAVYVKSRGNNYYGYAPQLTIVQTA